MSALQNGGPSNAPSSHAATVLRASRQRASTRAPLTVGDAPDARQKGWSARCTARPSKRGRSRPA
eukprot:823938-Pleurochrysis_carterae.AAC.1